MSVLDALQCAGQNLPVLSHDEIVAHLKRLLDSGVKQGDVAKVMRVSQPRISEMLAGKRRVAIDEAKRLLEEYRIEQAERSPISEAIARLVVLHVADELEVQADPTQVAELAQDVRAFSEFVTDPTRRTRPDLVEGLFAGRRSLRQEART